MRGLLMFLCFLFTLPVVGAFCHDLWIAMEDPNGIDFSKPFPFSDLGWLWKTYDLESMKTARDMIEPEMWKDYIGPVLEQKSVVATGIPALFFYALTALLKIFGIPPFEGEGLFAHKFGIRKRKEGKNFSFTDTKKGKKTKYKRR